MKNLEVEVLIKNTQCLHTLMHKDKTSKRVKVKIFYFQHTAGTLISVLENNK